MAGRASFPPGDAREDWAILRALSDVLGRKLPYDSLTALRQTMFKAHPHLQRIDQIAAGDVADIEKTGRARRHAGQDAVRLAHRRFLSFERHRARFRCDG